MKVSQVEARSILEALKRGGVPWDYAKLLAVGRDHWLSSVSEDLEFVASGGAKSRIIVAPYGGGKTHFLTLVSDLAFNQNFLVSYVELHSRESPFDRFEMIFGKVMRQIRIGGGNSGVQKVLDVWAESFPFYTAKETDTAISEIARSMDFRKALRAYLDSADVSSSSSLERRQDIVAWLQGDRLTSATLRPLGIRNRVTITNVSEIFTSFLELTRAAGFAGLVLLLDEAEAITSLSQSRRREESNQNLRKLLDNTDGNRGFYMLFATTQRFMEDPERGARSYPALWDRIRNLYDFPSAMASKRSMVMKLEPLNIDEYMELSQKVVQVHETAWNWSASKIMDADNLGLYWNRYEEVCPDGPVRPFLRTLIDLLDVAQQSDDSLELSKMIEGLSFGEA